jgi:hypothetical protein
MRRSLLLATALVTVGCSTRPREFTPQLAAPAPAAAAAEAPRLPPQEAVAACRTMVAAGKRSDFAGTATAAGAGVATAYGAGLLAAGGGGAGLAEGIAAGVAGATTMVLIAPVAIWGISRAIRAGKEKEIKAAMAQCLLEHGYRVDKWERAPRAVAASSTAR